MISVRGTIFKYGLKALDRLMKSKKTAGEQQRGELKKLLQKAADTQFGRFYHFDKMLLEPDMVRAFQQAVPIHSYEQMYEQWWHRLLEGEADICWRGKIKYFGLSSGTSGSPSKYIPVSTEMLKAMRRASANVFRGSLRLNLSASFYGRQFFILSGCVDLTEKNGCLMGDISGINSGRIPSWFEKFYKPGKRIARIKDWEERVQEIARQAPKWDVGTICGIPSWIQMMLERVITHNKARNIHDVWPNLQVYVTGGIALGPYRRRIEQLMGKPMFYLDTYYASEGCLAGQRRFDNEVLPMELFLNNGIFFEFVPFDEQHFDENGNILPDAQAIDIEQVVENKDYALVLSTCSGAWRYLIGDTIKFISKKNSEILITGRTGHFLSICGEHLSVDNMNQAVVHLERSLQLSVPEFTVKAVKVDNHFEHHWFLGVEGEIPPIDNEKITETLDHQLCMLNDDYKTERRDNLLKKVKVQLLPLSAFFEWQARQGKIGGQNKFPRVMKDTLYQDWLAFVQGRGDN